MNKMATIKNTNFTSYSFTEDEAQESSKFSGLNRLYIQNRIADVAMEKALLPINISNINEYVVKLAHLDGQMYILHTLLEEVPTVQEDT
jgi:hypothetical protein